MGMGLVYDSNHDDCIVLLLLCILRLWFVLSLLHTMSGLKLLHPSCLIYRLVTPSISYRKWKFPQICDKITFTLFSQNGKHQSLTIQIFRTDYDAKYIQLAGTVGRLIYQSGNLKG